MRGGLGQLEASAARPLLALATALGRADDLVRENARLRHAASRNRSRAGWADALARDNAQLGALTGLSAPGAVPQIPARVVALSAGRPGSGMVLDRGTEAGIRPGMPVVAGGALIGRVVAASARRASVLSIAEPGMTVGVRLTGSGEVGVVEGSGGILRLQLLDPAVEAADGDLVVTAGLQHGRFPPALPVGHVRPDRRTIAPVADVSRLEVVEVLTWKPPA
ncbi:MAG: rod shape-determining protein MreC [Actinomycetota bacterium]|nr:rod shape-determining protein MreC [Actinomycetota bacterium]